MNNKKGNILLLLISGAALVAVVISGYLFYQNQLLKLANEPGPYSVDNSQAIKETPSDETVVWKTYTNRKMGFTLNYPPNWKFLEFPNPKYQVNGGVWFASGNFPPPATDAVPEIIINDFVDEDPTPRWGPEFFDEYKTEDYKLGNIPAKKITGKNKVSLIREYIIIAKINGKYLTIFSNQSKDALKYIDQILSTFLFTK